MHALLEPGLALPGQVYSETISGLRKGDGETGSPVAGLRVAGWG